MRLAMQGKPLTAQRESTKGGDLQQLVIRLGQMLDFVEVDDKMSQLDRAVLVQLGAEVWAARHLASVEELARLVGKMADAHANVDELGRQLRAKELALTAVVATAAESHQNPDKPRGTGHSGSVRSTGTVEVKSATTKARPTAAPRSSAKPAKPSSPPAEQIHFSRDEEGFLADRVQKLEAQGVKEGVHVTFFDMGGQPEFASIAAEFLRR
jgi:hypothetical protein